MWKSEDGLARCETGREEKNVPIVGLLYAMLPIDHRTWEGHVHSYDKAVLVHSRCGGGGAGVVGLLLSCPAGRSKGSKSLCNW